MLSFNRIRRMFFLRGFGSAVTGGQLGVHRHL